MHKLRILLKYAEQLYSIALDWYGAPFSRFLFKIDSHGVSVMCMLTCVHVS